MTRLLPLFAALALAATPVRPLHAQTADEKAVLEVVQRLFDGMRANDSAMVRSAFHPEARLITRATREGRVVVNVVGIDAFVRSVAGAGRPLDERIYDPEVRVDGDFAQVWTYYTFHLGETFSHCGVDGFQLVRTEEGWKIVSIGDTRRKEGCEIPERR